MQRSTSTDCRSLPMHNPDLPACDCFGLERFERIKLLLLYVCRISEANMFRVFCDGFSVDIPLSFEPFLEEPVAFRITVQPVEGKGVVSEL